LAYPSPRGVFTWDNRNFSTYVLPDDITKRWNQEQQLQFLVKMQKLSGERHQGKIENAFAEWAESADPEEVELGRKVLWEWAHVKV
jgi:hypothetical protein